MRRLGLRRVVVAWMLVAVTGMIGAGVGEAAVATPTTLWPSASALTLPAGAAADQAATSLPSISCPSAASCVAVGGYSGAKTTEPMALTQTAGDWSAATVAPPTGTGVTASSLSSVACASAGSCVAVGEDTDASAHEPIVAVESAGTWGGASEIALPSGATAGALTGVACASGDCSLVGSDTDAGASEPMAVTDLNNVVGTPTQLALPTGATSGRLNAVSCSSAGNCVAVGSDLDGTGQTQAMFAVETNGTWGAGTEISLPTGANPTGQNAALDSISCPSSGGCNAVGSYLSAAGEVPMVITESGSGFAPATQLALPAGAAASGQAATLDSVSCTSASACTATGSYLGSDAAPMAATESGSVWGTATTLPQPSDAVATSSPAAIALAVDCVAAQTCVAAGTTPTGAGVGAMTLTSHPSLLITTTALAPGVVGRAYARPILTVGGVGGNAWRLTAGALPTGLTLNATTGVVSGTPTTHQSATFSVSVTDAAGDQASATFTLRVATPAPPHRTHTPGKTKKKKTTTKRAFHGAKVLEAVVVRGDIVHLTVVCERERSCVGRAAVVVVEHLRGKRVIAINSSTRRARRTRLRWVTLASVRYHLGDGGLLRRTLRLDRTGRRLLARHRHLDAGIALHPVFKRWTIVRQITLRQPTSKARHHRHAHRHATTTGAAHRRSADVEATRRR